MRFLERKLQELGYFFSSDILSFSTLVFIGIFLINHLASADVMTSTASVNGVKLKTKKATDDKASGSLSKQIKFQNNPSEKNWQLNLGFSASQKAVNDGTQKDQNNSEYDISVAGSYKFTEDVSLKALMSYATYTKNELQNDLSDLLLSLYFWKSKMSPSTTFKPYLLSTLPVSKDSRQRQQMNIGYGFGGSLSNQSGLASGNLTLASSISFQKYSHNYETALNNTLNTSYSSNQQISTGWDFKQIGFVLMLRHINSWNYADAMRESFFHLQEFSWSATNKLSFSVGHSNSGNVLSPNQEDIEVRLIDDNRSTVYLSTNYVL